MAKFKYPTVFTSESKKNDVKRMSPKKFLKKARKLNVGKGDRAIIDSFKEQIEEGKPLSPLKLLKHNKEDGRHRATAAKELGVDTVPVIDERKGKATGGAALGSNDPNRFMQDIMKFSFQILPLLQTSYLKQVPKQGFAHGGRVLEDDYPTHYLPNVGRQVMADGGSPRFAAVDPSMLVGASSQPFRGGEAYTDVGGQKVAAPFVTGMSGGYPTFNFAPTVEQPKYSGRLPEGTNPFMEALQMRWLSKLMGYAEGGSVEDLISRALDAARKSLGGYVTESKKIPSHGTKGYETDIDRLREKMKEVQEGEDKYD